MTEKFAFILNKKIETGNILNAVAHMAAVLVARANEQQRQNMFFVDYLDAQQNKHPVSGLSLIVLTADNANQIRTARDKAKIADIHFVDFIGSMTEGSYQEQMERTAGLSDDALDYWGLALFGDADSLAPITKKFSLYKR